MSYGQPVLRVIMVLVTLASLAVHEAGARGAGDQRRANDLEARQVVGTWSLVESPLTAPWELTDIDMTAGDDGWTVGDSGAILHWDGTAWQRVASPINNDLEAVSMRSDQVGWVIASDFSAFEGFHSRLLRWNGLEWKQFGDDFPEQWRDVDIRVSDAASIVGALGAWRWDGSSWSRNITPSGLGDWWGVSMLSSRDGWAVGRHYGTGNDIVRWNGTRWTAVPNSVTQDLRSIDMIDATDGWAVGDGGTIIRWDGQSWGAAPSPTISELTSVDMVSPDDGWATGAGGTLLHWDGLGWTTVNSPTDRNLSSIAMVSANDGWAVGEGVILRYRGEEPDPTVPSPTASRAPAPSPTHAPQPAYLPVTLRYDPPLPFKPQLLPIVNSDEDGAYTVEWRSALLSERYALEEDDNVAFGSPTRVFEGTALTHAVEGAAVGVHYYRVRGVNTLGRGMWSDPVGTVVRPPKAFGPVADAMISDKFPTVNVGSAIDMEVGYHPKGCLGANNITIGVVRSLVRFDLVAVPQGTPVTRAVLHLFVRDACWSVAIDGQWRTLTAYRIDEPWDEGTVTWQRRPKDAESVGAGQFHAATDLFEVTLDVTHMVRQWVDGRMPNHGFLLRAPESSNANNIMVVDFRSRESEVAAERPVLVLEYGE